MTEAQPCFSRLFIRGYAYDDLLDKLCVGRARVGGLIACAALHLEFAFSASWNRAFLGAMEEPLGNDRHLG